MGKLVIMFVDSSPSTIELLVKFKKCVQITVIHGFATFFYDPEAGVEITTPEPLTYGRPTENSLLDD